MVEGGMKCVKYILFAFNLIFFLAGLGLIIVGAVVQTKFATYFDFFGSSFSGVAILLIIVGAVIFIIGFFGCCGAYKENYCMTMTFAVLLGLIFLLEIAAGIAAYAMKDKVEDLVRNSLADSMDNYDDQHAGVKKAWNTLQHDFKCCGVGNYTSWAGKGDLGRDNVPDSCCIEETENCGRGVLTQQNPQAIYRDGCVTGFVTWVKDNIYVIGGVGIGLAFVQIVGVLLACCLARTIKKEYEVV